MDSWAAEIEVTEALARELLGEQFPALSLRSLERFDEGWDNTVFFVDKKLLFRFPRRQIAVAGVEREMSALPILASLLPLPIPRPIFLGRISPKFPWPFFGYERLTGIELSEASLSEAQRDDLALPLADFLRALHASPTRERIGALLPVDPFSRSNPAARGPHTLRELETLRSLGVLDDIGPWVKAVEAAAARRAPSGAVVCHGDFHFRHLLVDKSCLSGIVDWGDLCLADPCLDLSIVFSQLAPKARVRFFARYGFVTPETLSSARLLAIFLSAVLAVYGEKTAKPSVRFEALASLRRVLVD